VFVNDIAAKMHHLVEHREPGVASGVANIVKNEDDVTLMMQLVRREGDSFEVDPTIKAEPSTSTEEILD